MPRVSSQKTRQMLLVTGDPLDPNTLPEKVQLFNERGEPLMIGAGSTRISEAVSTARSLDPDRHELQTLAFAPSIRVFKIFTNRPARVRIYPTAAQRDADVSRPIGIKPKGNHGRLFELVTSPGLTEYILSPIVDMTSAQAFDSKYYATVTNLDTVAGVVIVTYHYFRTE